VNEAQDLVEEATCRGLTLAVGYQLRAVPAIRQFPRDWKTLHIWDRQKMSGWPIASYQRDMIVEFSHELDLACFLAGSPPDDTYCKWLTPAHAEVMMRWTDGRMATIELRSDYEKYERGALASRSLWEFSYLDNEQAYRDELVAFLDGKPLCTGREGLEVVKLMEALR